MTTKITDLSSATSLAASDVFPVNQSSATKKMTLLSAASAFASAPTSLWTFRASTTANSSNATSVTINKPSGVTNGDLMVFFASTRNSVCGDPSGGATVTELYDVDTSSNERAGCWYKTAGGSEPASYTLSTTSGATGRIAVVCLAFTGVSTLVRWGSRQGADDCQHWCPSVRSTPGGLTIYGVHNCFTDPGTATWLGPGLTAVSANNGSDTSIYTAYRMSQGQYSGGAAINNMTVDGGDYLLFTTVTFG